MSSKYSFRGLSDVEVASSRQQHGDNNLPPPETETFMEKLMENFQDPLIKILIVALIITTVLAVFGFAEWFEGVGIAAAVFLATFVATYSEYKNENSFQELQEEASKIKCNVFRNGSVTRVFIGDLVKGDYILLQPGDKVPADGVLIEGSVHLSQQSLNGESVPCLKQPAPNAYKIQVDDFNDPYALFRESIVHDGEGVMICEYVGEKTKYGEMAVELAESEERQSPLQVKLTDLADNISMAGYIGATLIAVSFLFKQFVMDQNYELDAILAYIANWQVAMKDAVTALILAIIVIVVAVPEGLPMMIAIVLSLNMKKLLDANVLVRKLLGIETAGSLNILFSDKTGTLTKGELETHLFVPASLKHYDSLKSIPTTLAQILSFTIQNSTSSHVTTDGDVIGGNASDRAFLSFVERLDIAQGKLLREKEIIFNSTNKFSATQVIVDADVAAMFKSKGQKVQISLIKGAPEKVLPACDSYYAEDGSVTTLKSVHQVEQLVTDLSHQGYRVIAVATSPEVLPDNNTLPKSMTLVGVLGIKDEVRAESKKAIKMVNEAGVQVVMVTGDRTETGVSVARELELITDGEHQPRHAILTSQDMRKMSDEDIAAVLPEIRVIARALPTDKSRLVRIAQAHNMVVGMTGDGVNDAAALKKSDVGFGMGSGTEVAKAASDIVILDDNFMSIAQSILYGRTIFKSIRKFIVFQSTMNVASTLIVFLGPFMGFDFPLTLIQLLWVNLVMDTLAALAFGGEPALQRYMKEKPIGRNESIISPDMWSAFGINGCFIALISVVFLVNDSVLEWFGRGEDVFLTSFFAFYIFISAINAFNVRTPSLNLLDNLISNTGFIAVIFLIFTVQIIFTYIGGQVLRTVPLQLNEWLVVIAFSFIIIPFDLLRKVIVRPCLPAALIDSDAPEPRPKEESDDDVEKQKND